MTPLRLLGWALAAILLSAWLALVEVFWLPLRLGGVLLPVSVLAAGVGNLMLVALAYRVSGSRVVAALPALVWLAVAVAAAVRRPEGDLVLTGGGNGTGAVNLVFLFVGVVAGAFAAARVLATPRAVAPRAVSRPGSGSGSGGAR